MAPIQCHAVIPTKEQLDATARRGAPGVWKYDFETMPLQDAISVSRVRAKLWTLCCPVLIIYLVDGRSSPGPPQRNRGARDQDRYAKGNVDTQGHLTWPREEKPQLEERIPVFAEGCQEDRAKRAGDHIVGGLGLEDAVSTLKLSGIVRAWFPWFIPPRLSVGVATRLPSWPSRSESPSFNHPELGQVLGPRGLMPSERTATYDVLVISEGWKAPLSGSMTRPRPGQFAPRLPGYVHQAFPRAAA